MKNQLWYALLKTLGYSGKTLTMTPRNVILVTGCDSGLG